MHRLGRPGQLRQRVRSGREAIAGWSACVSTCCRSMVSLLVSVSCGPGALFIRSGVEFGYLDKPQVLTGSRALSDDAACGPGPGCLAYIAISRRT